MNEEKEVKVRLALLKSTQYRDLYESENFQLWKKEQLDDRMNRFRDTAMGAQMTTEEGRQLAWVNIVAYQELKAASEDCFKLMAHVQKKAKEKLQPKQQGE